MKKLAVLLLLAAVALGCGSRPASEVSQRAKGWVTRFQRAVKDRDQTKVSAVCNKVKEPQTKLTESELRMFAQACSYCENEQWEEAENYLSGMAGESE